jgi:hypothetical protein
MEGDDNLNALSAIDCLLPSLVPYMGSVLGVRSIRRRPKALHCFVILPRDSIIRKGGRAFMIPLLACISFNLLFDIHHPAGPNTDPSSNSGNGGARRKIENCRLMAIKLWL